MKRNHWSGAILAAGALLVVAACQSIPIGTASPPLGTFGTSAAPSPAATQPAPTPTGIPTIGGVPTSVEGAPVVMGDALRAEVKARPDSTPFLAGGWFRLHDRPIRYCALDFMPQGMSICLDGFELFDARTGPWVVWIVPGGVRPSPIDMTLPDAADRPVVLRIHLHDAACAAFSGIVAENCGQVPVIDGAVWLGPAQTEPAIPTTRPSEPTDGMSRADAIALAVKRMGTIPGRPLVLVCAELRQYSEVTDDAAITADPWMWVMVFRRGVEDWNRVGLEDRTGTLLVGEFHVAPVWC